MPARGRCDPRRPTPRPRRPQSVIPAGPPPRRGSPDPVRPHRSRETRPRRRRRPPPHPPHPGQVGINGTVDLTGTLDLRDALDLDDALNRGATTLGAAGCGESHDVRRTIAAGDLARGQTTLPYDDAADGQEQQTPPPRSQVVLHVHLTDTALTGGTDSVEGCLARVENTRSPIWVDRVRDWCASPHVQVTVRPVKDLDRAHPRRRLRDPRPPPDPTRADRSPLRVPLVHQTSPVLRHRPHRPPTTRAGTPAATTPHPCAAPTTAPRPTPPGPTTASTKPPTSGDHPTGCTSTATTTAPPRPHPRPDHPASPDAKAPHPAHGRGHRHVPA